MTEYLFPASIEEALVSLVAHDGRARLIAGGTDVMPDLRRGRIRPDCLVDITRIPGLNQIAVVDGWVEVGAAVTFAALQGAPFMIQNVHALVEAAASVGALGIQHAATWVGNIVQAMPAADGAVVALALAAEARVVDAEGASWLAVETLFRGPGVSAVDPSRQIVSHLRFPAPSLARGYGTAWRRVGRRASLVLPILNCAVMVCLDEAGACIRRAAVALGPVAPRPFRAQQCEAFLLGQSPTAEVFAQAARIAQSESKPRSSVMRASREYRQTIVPVMVGEALATAAGRARSQSLED
ncbi:MAG: FAD binding domain-containing protein [Chloroflexota bacterium]